MKSHLSNALYGVLDYGSYPVGMLIVAPVILHHRGPAEYGIWTVTTALVSIGGILASGFGDAHIQHVASRRGSSLHRPEKDHDLVHVVRTMMGIHLVLGVLLALAAGWAAPTLAARISASEPAHYLQCLWSFRIAAFLILMRALETVCVSTQRAFERYGVSVRISIAVRLTSLALAALLAIAGYDVNILIASSATIAAAGLSLQLRDLKSLLAGATIAPALDRTVLSGLLSFGILSWLIAVSGVAFNQIDRLMLGTSLGATALASYALGAQITQPIYGLASSGLHFLFPYLAHRGATISLASLRRPVLFAFLGNLSFVAVIAAFLALFGKQVLRAWIGGAVVTQAASILPTLALASALLGLNVTATYALTALGRMKTVTSFNVLGGLVMLAMMLYLTPRYGTKGMAIAKLIYGALTLGMYLPLIRILRASGSTRHKGLNVTTQVCEEA